MRFINKSGIFAVLGVLAVIGGIVYVFGGQQKRPPTWPEVLREYLGPPEYESIDFQKPILEQKRKFEIAGRTFEMPKVYISSNLGNKHVLPEGIFLIYVLPDFTPKFDFKDREEYEAVKKARRFAHMLLEPEAIRPSFEVMIENRRQNLTKEEYVGLHDGLELYRWYGGKKESPEFKEEIYLEKNKKGEIISFIECRTKESGIHTVTPGCSHKFRDNKILYKIYYNRKNYFSSWREQREKSIAFINSFEIHPKNSNNEEK